MRKYEELPFVAETGTRTVNDSFVGEQTLLWFRTNSGDEKGIIYSVGGNIPHAPDAALKDIQTLGMLYHGLLQSSDLEYRDGWLMAKIPNGSKAWWFLPEVLDVLTSDISASNKQRKLALLINRDTGAVGSIDQMLETWSAEFRATPQLLQRIQGIRAERPKDLTVPELGDDVPDSPENPDAAIFGEPHAAREDLRTAIAEMIKLLEERDFKNFVERYVQPKYRAQYRYKGSPAPASLAYDFDQQPHIVEMYLTALRHTQKLEPIMEGDTAIFTHWFERGPMETHVIRVGRFWYFR